MDFFQKMERKFGRYAISNITLYMVVGCIIGYVLASTPVINYLNFDVYSILHGQIWRLFTWILLPAPTGSGVGSMMLSAIFLLCLIPMGRQLEMALGTFKVNVLIIGGIILSDVGGIILYFIFGVSIYLTTYYILLSIFMALAICFPNAQVNLYFLIPIKMKWILFLYIADMLYDLFALSRYGTLVLLVRGAVIIFAVLNFFIFFWFVARKPGPTMAQKKRQQAYRTNTRPMRGNGPITKHKCAVCGRTELDDPNLEFRFCSKCEGNYEYCQDHLFTHQHMKH